MTSEADTGRTLCELLDLARPGLAAVRELVDRGNYVGAMAAYRDRLVDLTAMLDMGEPPGFWLWNATRAEDLLQNGMVATAQYGEFSRVTRYKLGPPGAADWNKIPEDGYDVVLRDLPTMHWTGPLLEAYRGNKDPAYLKAYLGYWDDFARNWLPAHQKLLQDQVLIQWAPQPHVRRSIPWASQSTLYFAWRLDALFSWLATGIAVSPEQAKQTLDPRQLATVMLHVARFEVPGAIRSMKSVGTPNQFVLCALGLLKTSLMLQDLREGPAWTETAVERMEWYLNSGGYLADGSDQEQSFNYNPGLIHALDSFLHLARANPPLKGRELPWMARFQEARDYRERFMDSIVMPDGRRPATGCDNTWTYSRDKAAAAYAKAKSTLPPLRERISNRLLADGTLPEPVFTSICFPYGGWVVMRDGWTPAGLYAFMKTSRPAPGHMREGGNGLAMAAYGRYLLVNSGADAYSDRGIYNRYFDSTVSQSSVSVDGFSQVLNAAKSKPQYDKPIPARWHTSSRFDVAEGVFDSGYGGWNFRTGTVEKPLIDDVRHERQLVFLRQAELWVVTDRLLSSGKHDYTQSWCLGPEYDEAGVAVGPDSRSVSTHAAKGPNLELRFSSPAALTCSRHTGEKSDMTALGWRAFDWDGEHHRFAAGVDVLTEWRGQGNQLAVTLIVPSRARSSRIVTYRDLSAEGVAGFQAQLRDGHRITYLASEGGLLKTEGIEVKGQALLVVAGASGRICGVVLEPGAGDGYEFELDGASRLQRIADIRVPETFRWAGPAENLMPKYE